MRSLERLSVWQRMGHARIIVYTLGNEAIIRVVNTSLHGGSMQHLTARDRHTECVPAGEFVGCPAGERLAVRPTPLLCYRHDEHAAARALAPAHTFLLCGEPSATAMPVTCRGFARLHPTRHLFSKASQNKGMRPDRRRGLFGPGALLRQTDANALAHHPPHASLTLTLHHDHRCPDFPCSTAASLSTITPHRVHRISRINALQQDPDNPTTPTSSFLLTLICPARHWIRIRLPPLKPASRLNSLAQA